MLSTVAKKDAAGNVVLADALWLGGDLVSVVADYGYFQKNLAASAGAYVDFFATPTIPRTPRPSAMRRPCATATLPMASIMIVVRTPRPPGIATTPR